MPTYACDECDKAFRKKQALKDHIAEAHTGEESFDVIGRVKGGWRWLSNLTLRQLGILFAVVLMSTLFAGTAFFASTLAPAGGSGQQRQGRYINPLTGYAADRVPDVSLNTYTHQQQLNEDEQLYALVAGSSDDGPAVLLQYSCTDCPAVVNTLQQVAQQYEGYVHVAPYRDMDSRVAATALGNIRTYEDPASSELSRFVCSSFQRFPVRFRPLACSGIPTGTTGDSGGSGDLTQ